MSDRRMPRGRSLLGWPAGFVLACLLFGGSAAGVGAPVSGTTAATATMSGRTATAEARRRGPSWVWPVPVPVRVVAPFRAPATPYSAGHRGIDLAADTGSAIVAPADGVVHHAGWVVDRFVVSIDHGHGVISSMEPVEPAVSVGDVVARGSPIGRLSAGGHCAARCLHLGARVDGGYVSPLRFLGGLPRAVLLPLDG